MRRVTILFSGKLLRKPNSQILKVEKGKKVQKSDFFVVKKFQAEIFYSYQAELRCS